MFWNSAFHLLPIARLDNLPNEYSSLHFQIWFWNFNLRHVKKLAYSIEDTLMSGHVFKSYIWNWTKKSEDDLLIILNCTSLLFRWQSSCDWYQHSFSLGTDVGYSSSRRKWEGIGWNRTMYGIFATSQDFGDTVHIRKSWCMYFSAEHIIFYVSS